VGDTVILSVISALVGGVVVLVTDVFRDGVKTRRARRGRDHEVARRAELLELVNTVVDPVRGELGELHEEVAQLTGLIAGGITPDLRPDLRKHQREDRP